jgi:hypothetical protein
MRVSLGLSREKRESTGRHPEERGKSAHQRISEYALVTLPMLSNRVCSVSITAGSPIKIPTDIPRRINTALSRGGGHCGTDNYARLRHVISPRLKATRRGATCSPSRSAAHPPASVPVELIPIIRKRIALVARAVGFECFTSFVTFTVHALSARAPRRCSLEPSSSSSSSAPSPPPSSSSPLRAVYFAPALAPLRLAVSAALTARVLAEYSPSTVAL